jgi:hypothetical protein
VSDSGDHVPEMARLRLLDDDTIEALVRGDDVDRDFAHLAGFARQVCDVGDGPAPTMSPALARLIDQAARAPAHSTGKQRRGTRRRATVAKVAGLGIVAKLGIGVSAAAAGVAGAGVAGVLPAGADHAVRRAVEVITPLELVGPDQVDDRARFGERVSSDATGESDGRRGVDGREISRDAPGAAHRPSGTRGSSDEPGAPSAAHEPGTRGEPAGAGPPADAGPPEAPGRSADAADGDPGAPSGDAPAQSGQHPLPAGPADETPAVTPPQTDG